MKPPAGGVNPGGGVKPPAGGVNPGGGVKLPGVQFPATTHGGGVNPAGGLNAAPPVPKPPPTAASAETEDAAKNTPNVLKIIDFIFMPLR